MDIDQVQAGEYELVAELFDQRTSPLDKPFDFKRYRRGDTVTLDVEEARRLYAAGAVQPVGQRQLQAAEQARLAYAAALALVPEQLRAELPDTTPPALPSTPPGGDQPAAERLVTGPVPPPASPEAKRPVQIAPKEQWVAYAVAQGASADEAEQLTKQELIEQFGR